MSLLLLAQLQLRPRLSICVCLSTCLSVYLPPPSLHPSLRPSPPPSRCGHAPGAPEMRLRNVSFLTVLLFGLCGLVSLSWYTAFSSSRGKTPCAPAPPVCVCALGLTSPARRRGLSHRSGWFVAAPLCVARKIETHDAADVRLQASDGRGSARFVMHCMPAQGG